MPKEQQHHQHQHLTTMTVTNRTAMPSTRSFPQFWLRSMKQGCICFYVFLWDLSVPSFWRASINGFSLRPPQTASPKARCCDPVWLFTCATIVLSSLEMPSKFLLWNLGSDGKYFYQHDKVGVAHSFQDCWQQVACGGAPKSFCRRIPDDSQGDLGDSKLMASSPWKAFSCYKVQGFTSRTLLSTMLVWCLYRWGCLIHCSILYSDLVWYLIWLLTHGGLH